MSAINSISPSVRTLYHMVHSQYGNNKGWNIFHMWHILVWDQNTCDNAYLIHVHHMVCCVALETLSWETGLWKNTFFTSWWLTSLFYSTWYSMFVFFYLLDIFLFFPLSIILCLSYSFEKCFSSYVLLVQLMDSLDNLNHAVSVVGTFMT